MKRLALALAATVVGSGCIIMPDHSTGSLDAGWVFIRTLSDNVTTKSYSCAQAGIDTVDVAFSSGWNATVACNNGGYDAAVIDGVPTGTQTVTFTAYRGSAALYSDQTTVTIHSGSTTTIDTEKLYGIYDDLEVRGYFRTWNGASGWSGCSTAGVATLTYSLEDYAGTVVAHGTVNCTDPAGVSFKGSSALDRDSYAIRMQGFNSGSALIFDSATTTVSPTCSGQEFQHYGPDTGSYSWSVNLYDVAGNSTLCQ